MALPVRLGDFRHSFAGQCLRESRCLAPGEPFVERSSSSLSPSHATCLVIEPILASRACEETDPTSSLSAAIASCKTGGMRRSPLSSSNHASQSDIHNLANRSSLAPAKACELVPMAKHFLALLIRRLHNSRYKPIQRIRRHLCLFFGSGGAASPAGDESRTCADVGTVAWRIAKRPVRSQPRLLAGLFSPDCIYVTTPTPSTKNRQP